MLVMTECLEESRKKSVRSAKEPPLRFTTGRLTSPPAPESVKGVNTVGLLWSKVHRAMQERGIALGWRGIAEGMTATYSWKEFFDMALARQLLTEQEYRMLEEKYALIWKWDLHN